MTDADKILKIVWDWVVEANDVGGVDADDLAWRLRTAGFGPPEDA